MKTTIALDVDGVLLDYHAAYAGAWERAFGIRPRLKNANAYWPLDRWDVERLVDERKEQLRRAFDDAHWATMPALPGALEACHALVDAGFDLVCVTAIRDEFAEARRRNIFELGFPVRQVIATGNASSSTSPKAAVIAQLSPAAFVDDYLPYHRGMPAHVHKALILREPDGSPNVGDELNLVDSMHSNLAAFADEWLRGLGSH